MRKYETKTYPDPFVRQISKDVIQFDQELKKLSGFLLQAMKDLDGVGLAAIQIGIPLRVIAVKSGRSGEIFVNPKILWKSKEEETDIEGCISVPKVFGSVWRSTKIKVRAENISGEIKKFEAQGFFARILQHEVDHTNGILYIDKVERIFEAPKGFILPDGTQVNLEEHLKDSNNIAF